MTRLLKERVSISPHYETDNMLSGMLALSRFIVPSQLNWRAEGYAAEHLLMRHHGPPMPYFGRGTWLLQQVLYCLN